MAEMLRRSLESTYIWRACLGVDPVPAHYYPYTSRPQPVSMGLWSSIHGILARENGLEVLGQASSYFDICCEFLLKGTTDDVLDLIDLSFNVVDTTVRNKIAAFTLAQAGIVQSPDKAIDELNHRFREHALGYQFAGGQLMRVDSSVLHTDVVAPVLSLLHAEGFEGANAEFMSAHAHYLRGQIDEALVDALKSMESALKTICERKRWPYDSNGTVKHLLDVAFQHDLLHKSLQSQFASLRSLLESGTPTVRNKFGGHGDGAMPIDVPDYIAAYALHTAAANIVLLVTAALRTE